MTKSIDRLVRDLRGIRDVNAHYTAIDDLVANGEVEQVVDLARAVEERPNIGADPWVLEAIYDRVVRALALSYLTPAATAALELGLASRKQSTQRTRFTDVTARNLAALLAAGRHSKQTMLALLGQPDNAPEAQEVFACWIQELIVRGNDFSNEVTAKRFWSRLRVLQHPLAALPLHLEVVESEFKNWLPVESVGGSSCGMPYGPSENADVEAPRLFEPSEPTELPARPNIGTVVANWKEESNGQVEARTFRFDRHVEPSAVGAAFMKTLSLECLASASVEQVVVNARRPEEALSILFAASANGGAYNRGRRAAYGRLEVWRTVAAMIGHENTDVSSLAEKSLHRNWYSFDAGGDWFEQIAWDLGIAVLSPDGNEMSILAATDTD